MLDIIGAFKNLIVSLWGFLTHSIESLYKVFTLIPRFINYVSSLIALVIPNEIAPFLFVAFSFLLLMVIIGRNSS